MSLPDISSVPRRPRVSSSPGAPVPPSVLMKAYISSSTSGRPSTSYVGSTLSKTPATFPSGWDNRLEKPTFERPRRTSDPSRSHARSASESSAGVNERISHIRTRPVNVGPRPTSSSYVPLRSSPLRIPQTEDTDVPVPIVLSYTPEPVIHEIHAVPVHPLRPSAKALAHTDLPPGHVNLQVNDTKRVSTTASKRFSFACKSLLCILLIQTLTCADQGLNSLFSGNKECRPTPNTLILENRYCEQYIPPTSEGIRFHRRT